MTMVTARVHLPCPKDTYIQTHGIRLRAKFRLDRFILSPSGSKKIVVSPSSSRLRKLNTGAHLQTFPSPTAEAISGRL